MDGFVHCAIPLHQLAMQLDWTSQQPGIEFLLCAISQMNVVKRPAMFEPAVSQELDKRRAALIANMRDRIAGGRIDRLDLLATLPRRDDPVAADQLGDRPV